MYKQLLVVLHFSEGVTKLIDALSSKLDERNVDVVIYGFKPLCLAWDQLTPVAIGLQGMQLWSFPKVQQPKACCIHRSLKTGPIIPSIHFIRIKYNTSKITVLNNPLNYCMKISSYLECIQHYYTCLISQTTFTANFFSQFLLLLHVILPHIFCFCVCRCIYH